MFHVMSDSKRISVAVDNNYDSVQAFRQAAGTTALKAGIAVKMDATSGKAVPATSQDQAIVGWLYTDAYGDVYNCPAYASGLIGVYHDHLIAATDVCEAAVLAAAPGTALYVNDDGKLTLTQGAVTVGSVIGTAATGEDVPAGTVMVSLYIPTIA